MPISSQFRSQTELVNYLNTLEQRIDVLEAENQALKNGQQASLEIDISGRVQDVMDERLPRTRILSSNFLVRAFTIWGYFFIAQLIIMAGVLIIILGNRIVTLVTGH